MEYKSTKHNLNKNIFTKFETKLSLTQIILQPTRVTNTKASTIDLLFTSDTEHVASCGVIKYNVSDHDLIYINLKKVLLHKPKVSFKLRDLKNLNLAQFNSKIQGYDWSDFYNSNSPTTAWEKLYSIYLSIADELVPLKEVYNVQGKEDWVSKEVLDDLKHRDELRGK